MIKMVNVFPIVPIYALKTPITGPTHSINLCVGDIVTCIYARAKVEEILPNGEKVLLDLSNYNKENYVEKVKVEEQPVIEEVKVEVKEPPVIEEVKIDTVEPLAAEEVKVESEEQPVVEEIKVDSEEEKEIEEVKVEEQQSNKQQYQNKKNRR